MSEHLSQRVVVWEAVLIVAPLSIAFMWLGLGLLVPPLFLTPWGLDSIIGLIALLAFGALISLWVLILSFLRGGSVALKERKHHWWWFPAAAALAVAVSLASVVLPPSPEYSSAWFFRVRLNLFTLGLPLALPFVHLVIERLHRRLSAKEALNNHP